MNALSGYKTTIVSAVAVIASVLWMLGVQVDLEFQAAVVTGIMGVAGVALNFRRAWATWQTRRF